MGIDQYIEAGLYDPESPKAAERLEMLQWLETLDLPMHELYIDERTGELAGDMARWVVRSGERLTADEARALTNLTREEFDRLSLASGYPSGDDTVGYTKDDAELFDTFATARSLFSEDELLNFMRVVSTSLSRVTDAAVSLFTIDVEAPMVDSGSTELELAQRQFGAVDMLEQVVPVMETLMRLNMELSSARKGEASLTGQSTMRLGIGFIDLVGFTPQSLDLESIELGALLMDFERTAHDTVIAGGGRIVKLIGDEVMFVAVDPSALCEIAQSLVNEFGHDGQVTPRGGLAYGDLLARSGDYFGPVVNLASRIGDLAVPNELLVTPELAEAAPDFSFQPAGQRMLKGFPEAIPLLSLDLS